MKTTASGLAACAIATLGAAAEAQVTLTSDAAGAGLVATNSYDEGAIPLAQDWQVGGLAVGDFNNDGWADIFWVGGGLVADKLFINNADGSGTFTEEAAAWGVAALHAGNGVSVGDYDENGYLDIFVTSFGPPNGPAVAGSHRMYHNTGTGSFVEVAQTCGVEQSCLLPEPPDGPNPAGYGSSFGDYDLDGHLDLMVTSWWGGDEGNRLFHNNGDATFTDVTDAAIGAVVLDDVDGFQPAFIDMDGDRFPEILLVADFHTSRYLVNNYDGTFTDQTFTSGTGLDEEGMGQAVADFNHDGLLDWYVTAVYFPPSLLGNRYYVNQGNHVYVDSAVAAGVDDGTWGWGALPVDLDHDTWTDLLEVNGRPAPLWDSPGRVYHNDGDGTFTDVAAAAGFEQSVTAQGRSMAYLDADHDGDLDIVVSHNLGALAYYRNDTSPSGNWLQLALDTSTNALLAPNGFGARVNVAVGAETLVGYMSGSPSYLSTSELVLHFGLGAAAQADIEIVWPNGLVTELANVAANQRLTVEAPGPGDADADGIVGVDDFLDVLAGWGACPAAPVPCLADFNGDGIVGVDDFLIVLANWG